VPNSSEQPSVKKSYDSVAEDYAQRVDGELAHKPFDRQVLDGFAEQLKGKGLVADLGCGPGMAAEYLHERGLSVFGIDISPRMVSCASRRHPGLEFKTGDFRRLEVPDASWAGIVAMYSLIHVPREGVKDVLMEFARVLQPGGLLLLAFHLGSEVRHASDWWAHPVDLDFVFFESTEMLSYVWGAGFDSELHVERDPYPDVELQTRRGYILARKPSAPSFERGEHASD
jgi:ubiquinone/menaquinone biosynthesis C-methylase UbiE